MQRGCEAFMQKPFNVYALSRTIRDVIDRRGGEERTGETIFPERESKLQRHWT